MSSQTIKIKINPYGAIDVGVTNGDGANCINITKRLEEALEQYSNVDPTKTLTTEYYKDSSNYLTEGF